MASSATRPAWLALALALVAALFGTLAGVSAAAPGAPETAQPRGYVAHEVLVRFEHRPAERSLELPPGIAVGAAAEALSHNPHVAYAAPNHIAHASAQPSRRQPFFPNDPGTTGTSAGWQQLQWNFLPCGSLCGEPPATPNLESLGGINAPGAWQNLIAANRPGAEGVTVAVVDTGVAYRNLGSRFRRSPDFARKQFVDGHDFVGDDSVALDENGHGTHVAGTIAERVHNKRAVTGLAYGARIMPVRVLDEHGAGSARNVARGIRWATRHGADIINLSLEFCLLACNPGGQVHSCDDVPGVCEAIDKARARGALVIGSAGNEGHTQVSFPARHAIAVGATTERACLAEYSNHGEGLDLVAPGGGSDGAVPGPQCLPYGGGRTIFQLTLVKPGQNDSFRRFGYPRYEGGSMASAHASGVAALAWALLAETLGRDPSPQEVQDRLISTTRNEGTLANPSLYGAGLIDAAAATAP